MITCMHDLGSFEEEKVVVEGEGVVKRGEREREKRERERVSRRREWWVRCGGKR